MIEGMCQGCIPDIFVSWPMAVTVFCVIYATLLLTKLDFVRVYLCFPGNSTLVDMVKSIVI